MIKLGQLLGRGAKVSGKCKEGDNQHNLMH